MAAAKNHHSSESLGLLGFEGFLRIVWVVCGSMDLGSEEGNQRSQFTGVVFEAEIKTCESGDR